MKSDWGTKVKVAVIDGQGGGIGKSIVEKLRKELPENIEIIALGTNAAATMAMMKAGASAGATGENAIVYNAARVDIITGVVGIIVSNSLMGEMTSLMAGAVAESAARKVLIPLNRCNIEIAGLKNETLPQYIDDAVELIKNLCKT